MLSQPHSRLPATGPARPSPTEPTVWVLPRPEVRLGTVHFWKSCWKTADSAPSFCTSTCVLGGYCLALMKFWGETGRRGCIPLLTPNLVQAKAWLLPLVPTRNLVPMLTLLWPRLPVQTRP